MAVFPFLERVIEFRTDLGVVVRACRSYLTFEFGDGTGGSIQWLAIIDSAAPFSVLPFTLWHDNKLPWQRLGSHLTRNDRPDRAALTWLGVPCELGETQVALVDKATDSRSRPLRLLAKFALARVSSPAEKEALLGYSFVSDNSLTLSMKGVAGKIVGSLTVE
jgi:hypothetical protein